MIVRATPTRACSMTKPIDSFLMYNSDRMECSSLATVLDFPSCSLDEGGEFYVSLREALAVVCAESDLHSVVHVKPLWMMVHAFCL